MVPQLIKGVQCLQDLSGITMKNMYDLLLQTSGIVMDVMHQDNNDLTDCDV